MVKKSKKKTKGKTNNNNINFPPMKKKQSKIKINSKKIDTLNSNKSNTALIKMENKSINLINNNNDIKMIENKSKVENNKNIRNILVKNNNRKMYRISFNDYEMNNLDYQDALKFDKRAYFEYYLSLLKTKHIKNKAYAFIFICY